jgi:hypothetical protein
MSPNIGLAFLAGALVLATAYYAWITHRLLGTVHEMVAATKELAETTWKTYALSVVPQVECRTATYDSAQNQAADATAGELVSETTITNVGPHRVRLTRVRLETDSGGERIRRFVTRWLVTNDRETVQIPFAKSSKTKVFVHLEDMAGQDHVVVSEPVHSPAKTG